MEVVAVQNDWFSAETDDLPASIPDLLDARSLTPDHDFIVGSDFRLTYGDADLRSRELAGQFLAEGVGKGTRVGILYSNQPEWVVAWLAATRIGALSVPLSTFSPGPELVKTLRHVDVNTLLMAPSFAGSSLVARLESGLPSLASSRPELQMEEVPHLRRVHVEGSNMDVPWSMGLPAPLDERIVSSAQREVAPSDLLVVVSTSGATAGPKSVVHTHGSLVRHAALLARKRGYTAEDRIYSAAPFFWVGGLTMVLLAALCSGAAAVIQERFEAGEALELIERERVTMISSWPNASRQMAEHPTFASRDLRSVRAGTLLEALPEDQRPPSTDLAPMPLGMTETGGPHTAPDDYDGVLPDSLRGTFGRTLSGMEHRVESKDGSESVEGEGELLVRGLFLMDGIYKKERFETFTNDGWYRTGDMGWFGEDGHLRFLGRRTGMVKTAGSNVSPAEVESALLEIPAVRLAFVFGIPAGDRGEDLAAVLVPEPEHVVDVTEIAAELRSSLSNYKVPRHFDVIKEADLPMLVTGKVDLAALRALFS
jgi:acyl-CoA synthetase (AMP-forming)/AMP-acid ligase II